MKWIDKISIHIILCMGSKQQIVPLFFHWGYFSSRTYVSVYVYVKQMLKRTKEIQPHLYSITACFLPLLHYYRIMQFSPNIYRK